MQAFATWSSHDKLQQNTHNEIPCIQALNIPSVSCAGLGLGLRSHTSEAVDLKPFNGGFSDRNPKPVTPEVAQPTIP